MLKNNLKIAWRNLLKGKTFNIINIAGLSAAIACCVLLFLTVVYEFSYDQFHKNLPDIYQVYLTQNRAKGIEKAAPMPEPLTPALKAEYPDVQYISRLGNGHAEVSYKTRKIMESVHFVDEDFLRIFTFPLEKGSVKTALHDLHGFVITEFVAKAIFGKENPVGKTVEVNLYNQPQSFVVSGVAKDFPDNSSISFDVLMRFENYINYKQNLDKWDVQNHATFVKLNAGTNPASFEKSLIPFAKNHFKEDISNIKRDGAKPDANGNVFTVNLAPFANNHFNNEIGGLEGSNTSKVYVIALLAIGIFILLIACINFINLNIARAFNRAREVGVRKTLGAGKWQLLVQFWVETALVCLIAFGFGLLISSLILPLFAQNFKSHIHLNMLLQPGLLLASFSTFFLITIIAGFYPAWLMLRYKTVLVLKGTVNTTKPGRVRNILLVTQFALSTLLIICTLVTWQQMQYMQNRPLGYNRTEVISIPLGNLAGTNALDILRQKLQGSPEVESVTGSRSNLGLGNDGSTSTSVSGFNYKGHELRTNIQFVDYNYFKTLGIQLAQGRDFSRDFATDSNAVVINEKMAAQIGSKNLIGTYLPFKDDEPPMQVIGVVKDYNFQSLHQEVEPLTLSINHKNRLEYVFVRIKPVGLNASFNHLKSQWHQIFPNTEFNGSWLNENTERQYRSEKRLSNMFISGAILAILISCIGLLAMAMMTMVQRTKEVGIRKVLGSSISGIVVLLSKDFIKLVLLASVLAFPVAYWVMHNWLQSFAYRIDMSWWIFALATLIALVIALATVSFQAVKAALANPVKSLRSE
ncbi:ABC transporter permease [uncultured Mucilaginibacter sp.]|uniref:ABC transporter permease n=1 Tax=uncultured Mucilaginibacter sp. TaxID=797541 RepID=UPI0026192F27|nr:ABC transporter permease [uncultured Mucilaginibacter sp.]